MRTRKLLFNSMVTIIETLVSIFCGLLVPRLILSGYGSKYYGVSVSITQFLSFAFLMRAGVGGATKSALYKPLAEDNYEYISAILAATESYMKRVSTIIALFIVGASIVYPFFVMDEFDWLFTASLFLIMGISTFFENFLGITYMCLLEADQKTWVFSSFRILCMILNTIGCVVLIRINVPFHVVKAVTSLIYVFYPVAINLYVRKNYHLVRAEPDFSALNQRWDAFFHQAAEFVTNNTDVIVLTVFTDIMEVSVYSVYAMVLNALKRLINSLTYSLESTFGDIVANKEWGALDKSVSLVETVEFWLGTIAYTSTAILIFDFVRLYTKDVPDMNYIRPIFSIVMILAAFFWNARTPYDSLIRAAGHYRQTKMIIMMEPVVNIILSLILVGKFGIIGVATGTLFATLYRTVILSVYINKNIIKRKIWSLLLKYLTSVLACMTIIFTVNTFNIGTSITFTGWIQNSILTVMISFIVTFLFNILFQRNDTLMLARNVFRR